MKCYLCRNVILDIYIVTFYEKYFIVDCNGEFVFTTKNDQKKKETIIDNKRVPYVMEYCLYRNLAVLVHFNFLLHNL